MLLECPNTMAIDQSHQRPWERVAQPVEHVTFNHGVLGSSPSALTKHSSSHNLLDAGCSLPSRLNVQLPQLYYPCSKRFAASDSRTRTRVARNIGGGTHGS